MRKTILKNASGEVRVTYLQEFPSRLCDSPESLRKYWQRVITKAPWFDPERECAVSVALNTKMKVVGHSLVGLGTLNECIVHMREVFRHAIVANAFAVMLVHNHPSGDPAPSKRDLKLLRSFIASGNVLGIPAVEFLIIGKGQRFHSEWSRPDAQNLFVELGIRPERALG